MKRSYKLGKRAAKQEATRRRIVEAAVDLHQTVGPARTTISAIAERAGVERLTIYRHFPSDEAIFAACSGHFEEMHPFPDASDYTAIADFEKRLFNALGDLYAYYQATAPMLENVLRDAPEVPAMREPVDRLLNAINKLTEGVLGSAVAQRKRVAVHLAMSFDTWRLLVREQGLDNEQAVALMTAMVRGSTHSSQQLVPTEPR